MRTNICTAKPILTPSHFLIDNHYETISGSVRSECSSCKVCQGSCWVDILKIKPFQKLILDILRDHHHGSFIQINPLTVLDLNIAERMVAILKYWEQSSWSIPPWCKIIQNSSILQNFKHVSMQKLVSRRSFYLWERANKVQCNFLHFFLWHYFRLSLTCPTYMSHISVNGVSRRLLLLVKQFYLCRFCANSDYFF